MLPKTGKAHDFSTNIPNYYQEYPYGNLAQKMYNANLTSLQGLNLHTQYKTDDWVYEPNSYTLTYLDTRKSVSLDPKSGRLLVYLITNKRSVVSRKKIYHELFGFESDRSDGTITAYVSKLRKILENRIEIKGTYLKTISKSGYQFIGKVQIIQDSVDNIAPDKSMVTEDTLEPNTNTDAQAHEDLDGVSKIKSAQKIFNEKIKPMLAVASFVLLVVTIYWQSHTNQMTTSQTAENQAVGNKAESSWALSHSDFMTNDAVAVTSDGTLLAFVEQTDDLTSLTLKSAYNDTQSQIYAAPYAKQALSSPAFSPQGNALAFVIKKDNQCTLYEVNFNETSLLKEHEQKLTSIGYCNKAPQVAYVDKYNILYLEQSATPPYFNVMRFNTISNSTFAAVANAQLEQNTTIGNYWFAYNDDSQSMAFLRDINGETAVFRYNFIDEQLTRVITVKGMVSALDWLTSEQLLVMQSQQLKIIDINKQDIKPTSFAQVKSLLVDPS
jgi:DNA-binding winged helix-turn-helix (wHTH) protein